MQYEMLNKITYPTGGFTTLEFEPHDYAASFDNTPPKDANNKILYNAPFVLKTETANQIAGGLRIRKIVSSDGVNEVEKTYLYVKDYKNSPMPSLSSGILGSTPTYFDNSVGSIGEIEVISHYFMNEQSLNPLNLTSGSPVTYSEVVGKNKDNSYTIYKFSNYNDVNSCNRTPKRTKTRDNISTTLVNPKRDPVIDYEHLRGRLLEQRLYTNTDVIVHKTQNEYSTYLDTLKAIRVVAAASAIISAFGPWAEAEFRASSYYIHTSPVYLLKTTATDYFYAPSTQITTITQNEYDDHQNIKTQTVTSLNNAEQKSNVTTTYSYAYDPADLTVVNPTVTETVVGTKLSMINRFMIGIPLETKNNFNQGSKNEFKNFNNGAVADAILPYIFYSQNKAGTFTEQFKINGYMNYDKPKETKEKGTNTPVVTYNWQEGLLKSKVYGTGLNQLTWTYNYDFAKRLLTDKTDENGLRMKFTYDGYRRLVTTYDRFSGTVASPQNVQATITYAYHYKGQTTSDSNDVNDVNSNFVRTKSVFKGVAAPLSTKQYLDGLGRPTEVVKEFYTPSNLHQKNYVSYDALGRQNRTFLPFESSTLGFQAASTFGTVYPYVETSFEASPLSRPISQKNVDGTYTYISYGANTAADAVQVFTQTSAAALVGASSSSVYAANTLSKTTMTDENGKLTYVFKDKLGRVILTRKLLNGNSGANVDTYNVYDDYGQLVVVLPPGSVNANGAINDLTFQYKYDNKNRLSAKKVPGAVPQKFYYDSRDLLVLTQDGNMAAESATKHLATLYDDIGRVVKTGFANVSPTEGVDFALTDDKITDKLTEIQYYPNKSWVKHQGAKVLKSANITTFSNFLWSYTDRRLSSTFYTGNPGWQGKQHLRYASVSQNPITDSDSYGVDWSVSDYNGMQQPDYTIRYLFEGNSANEVRTRHTFNYDNGRRLTDVKYLYTLNAAGLSDPTYTLSNMVYNFKDQLIEKNIGLNSANSGALQTIDYQYNVRGWLTNINNVNLNSTTSIMTPQGTGSGQIQNLAITPFINQAVQNALKPYRAANANELPPINDNNGDLFSQIITYGSPATATGATPQYNGNISSTTWQVAGRDKQAYGFTYDGLDRLTVANYFDIVDQYTSPYTSQYSTDNKFKEAVQYDVRGNIISLQRHGLNEGTWTTNDGYVAGTYGLIDNLVYNYKPNPAATDLSTPTVNTQSNQLLNVKDMSLSNKGFKYISANGVPTYTYDANGNLTSDLNKNIAEIKYNYLNLPSLIRFVAYDGFIRTIEFVYDATGVKLKKIAKVATSTQTYSTETYDYINGVEYKNDVLQRIAHTEGSVSKNENGAYEHQYVLRDHLGNVRVTFRDGTNKGDAYFDWNTYQYIDPNTNNVGYNDGIVSSADIMQINHYYPFGLNMEGNWQGGASGQNKYQYNEKELNQDFGLDWNDYGARFYDPALARWTAVDPLADKYLRWTPYNYTMDNPMKFIDPDGRDVIYLFDDTAPYGTHISGHSAVLIGSDAKGWQLYSKTGDNLPDGTAKVDKESFSSVQDFYSRYASNGTHSAGFYMRTTPENDERMLEAAEKNAYTTYELEGNNCADLCRTILSAGGIDIGERRTAKSWPFENATWPRADLGEISSKNEGQNLYFMPKGKEPKTVEGQVKQSQHNKDKRQNNTFFFSQLLNSDGSLKVAEGMYMFDEQGKLNKVN